MSPPSDLSPRLSRCLADSLPSSESLRQRAGIDVTVVGRSMQPTLRVGQRVRVERCGYLWPGDVALLRATSGEPVLHRVVAQVPGTGRVVHAGDAGGRIAVTHRSRVIGRAALPRRMPPGARYVELGERLVRALGRRGRAWLGDAAGRRDDGKGG